jgi:hypothetical protein
LYIFHFRSQPKKQTKNTRYLGWYIGSYNIVIHRIWAVLQSDWLNYSPYISSYTASSEKQDGGPKTTWVLRSRKKENIRFEKDNSTTKNSQKIWQVSKIHLLHRN